MARLSQEELIQAVREWCERRGVDTKGHPIRFHAERVNPGSEHTFTAEVYDLLMPIKEGPYR